MLSNCRARRGNPPFLPFFDDCNVINSDNRNEITVPFGDDPSPLRHRVPALYLIVECRPWPLLEIARRTADQDEACDPLVRAAERVADGIRLGGPAGEPAAHKPPRMPCGEPVPASPAPRQPLSPQGDLAGAASRAKGP